MDGSQKLTRTSHWASCSESFKCFASIATARSWSPCAYASQPRVNLRATWCPPCAGDSQLYFNLRYMRECKAWSFPEKRSCLTHTDQPAISRIPPIPETPRACWEPAGVPGPSSTKLPHSTLGEFPCVRLKSQDSQLRAKGHGILWRGRVARGLGFGV